VSLRCWPWTGLACAAIGVALWVVLVAALAAAQPKLRSVACLAGWSDRYRYSLYIVGVTLTATTAAYTV
jgi:hypothetical protein